MVARVLFPLKGCRPFFLYVLPEVYETNGFSSSGVGEKVYYLVEVYVIKSGPTVSYR